MMDAVVKRVAVAVLLLALLGVAACGDDEPEQGAEAAKREGKDAVTEEMLTRALAEIDALERACTPQPGSARAEVERRFGEGTPVLKQKGWPEGPPDSPIRMYRLLLGPSAPYRSARLIVTYDVQWKVRSAFFRNPYVLGGELPGGQSLRERYDQAHAWLGLMRHISEATRKHEGK